MKRLIIILLLMLFNSICISQVNSSKSLDTSSFKYLPLKVGHIWVYQTMYWHPPFPTINGRMRVFIEKDTVMNSHKYFSYKSTVYSPIINYGNNGWLRIDSATGNLMGYQNNYSCGIYQNERILDSLASKIHDTLHTCNYINRKCLDTNTVTKFGLQIKTKYFQENALSCGCNRYAKNFGLVSSTTGELSGNAYELLGCVFDGIVYGDTIITGLEITSVSVPEYFSLYQNYPNPFNPSTKIKFDIQNSPFEGGKGDVKLIVYDVLGKEISVLVNQQIKPGTYEVEWDGSNYSSGIYFYKLQTAGYTETKRMVLIK